DLVQNIDYAPTFLDIAGADIPEDIQGISILPILKDSNKKIERNALYYHFYEYPAEHAVKKHYGIYDGRYKLIHFYDDIDVWELYDRDIDPKEMTNVYNNPEYQEIIIELKNELKKLQIEYNDPILEKYPL
ncbi:MAG: DUF4976 domain-containing protein, partial [Bacteroidales bacterium]|nr:DUF4976 domain-containing protein [Bacteroidales bacterium]